MAGEPKQAAGWALFTPTGSILHGSVRRTRREVVEYADGDIVPTWTWDRYRKRGFYIAKVEIRPLPPAKDGEA